MNLMSKISKYLLLALLLLNIATALCAYNPPERLMVNCPTFEGQTERDLRYKPDNGDFVIVNGKESFNRPLYGGNSALRVDAGDLPEFSFYIPRHGGVVRFGIQTDNGSKWLVDAERIISRYRAGSMIYEITDSLLGDSELILTVIGLYDTEGLVARVEINDESPVQLITAFGGIGGRKGKRSGDIGCESEPVSSFFKFKPQYCKDNKIQINGSQTFDIDSKFARFYGVFSSKADISIVDANDWADLSKLIASKADSHELPLVLSQTELTGDKSVYFALQRNVELKPAQALTLFNDSEARRREIASQVVVETPDEYINAAAKALCIAADAIWDDKIGSVLHGAVAWRSKYLGWRGPYANDVLGWHDRAETHLKFWSSQQNTKPVPEAILPADPTAHLARNEPSLHSNGDMSGKHYDMNLVYIDALIRHILWTGDLEFAEQLWPVIERHMAWERRLFRRTYANDGLPLYEAYAAIWASDDMQYHGGGVTYTSAYNYYHNLMVARIAEKLGKDYSGYQQEADLILKGMRKYLWLEDCGWYGEWKDLLGLQKVHPAAGLWSFYHTLDSEAVNPFEAWQFSRYIDTNIAHIPVYGGDIPSGKYYTLPTSNWMPYTWSTNNVVTAEVAHTALAYWQAGRPEKAMSLFKGCLLDNMFMGLCPGNAGMTTFFDMARGEAQRDFGDGIGCLSRGIVEGLFGIKPDLLSGRLTITPGFPDDWSFARIKHTDLSFEFNRNGNIDSYVVNTRFSRPHSLDLCVRARGSKINNVIINGKPAQWSILDDSVGTCNIQIQTQPANDFDIQVQWKGDSLIKNTPAIIANNGKEFKLKVKDAKIIDLIDPQGVFEKPKQKAHSIKADINAETGHRTVFAKLKQGKMKWWQPIDIEVKEPYKVVSLANQKDNSLSFKVENNTDTSIDSKVSVSIGNKSKSIALYIPAFSISDTIELSAKEFDLMPGSNLIEMNLVDNTTFSGIVTNWHIKDSDLSSKSEPVELKSYYNDKITQIFKNEYLTPRSPYCSLAIPKQGIGSWCNFAKQFDVDDSGLRMIAANNEGEFIIPQGVSFKLPTDSDAANCVFTSQWDNYPESVNIDLSGTASHIYLLMAGSTNSMQSQFDNGEVIVTYKDGTIARLALRNPTTWWPIDQDYFIDDYGFRRPEAIPPRVDLKTGKVRTYNLAEFKGKGGNVPGGAATVLDLPLDSSKELETLTVRTLANEVVIGLLSAEIVR